MTIALIISAIAFVISIVLTTLYFYSDLDWAFFIGCPIMLVSGIAGIVLSALVTIRTAKSKPLEFPASKYTLSYKITEFEGQKDTTYVLILKEK